MREHTGNHPPDGHTCDATDSQFLISRRQFLFGAGAALAWLTLPAGLWRPGMPERVQAQISDYARERIGRLSELKLGEPIAFYYPWEHPNALNYLIKLGQPAGGGVGPEQDVVAFNSLCTHQGGSLAGKFNAAVGVAGPCPIHWTTFDLTRHGMVVSGHATLGLPQIILETDGDDIYATGVLGLIFGYYDNRVNPATGGE